MIRVCSALAVVALLVSRSLAQANLTPQQWATVINLSGRQRMLSQKMSKEALFINAGVNPGEMRKSLTGTTLLFETTLSGLRDGDSTVGLPATTDDNIIAQLDKVKSLYEELKPVFAKASEGSLDDTSLGLLAEKNVPLLVEMNKAVKMYEAAAKDVLGGDQQSAVVINLAGRQRMLTQKMTKEALLVHLGVNVEANSENLTATTTMFDTTLKGLVDGNAEMGLPGTKDPEILAQLGKVKALWDSVLPVVSNGSLNDGMLTDLSTSNVTLLKEMNKAVGMYAEAAK